MLLPLQSLGLQDTAVPGLKTHPSQRPRGSAPHQAGQDSSNGGAEGGSADAVPGDDMDRAVVPFHEPGPGIQEDAAAAEDTQPLLEVKLIFDTNKVRREPLRHPNSDARSPPSCRSSRSIVREHAEGFGYNCCPILIVQDMLSLDCAASLHARR